MRFPGFTAENSLGRPTTQYRSAASGVNGSPAAGTIHPQHILVCPPWCSWIDGFCYCPGPRPPWWP